MTANPPNANNPYLLGGYAPIHQESELQNLEVIGEIPRDLNGLFVRNGPNPRYVPKGRYHWFDGDGMLHAIQFDDGRAVYRNRWVQTWGLKQEQDAGAAQFSGLIEPDFRNPLGPIKDSANTDVLYHGGSLRSLWYRSGAMYNVDPLSLDTKGREKFGGALKHSLSAHAKVDERTGEMFVFHYGPNAPHMFYGVVSASGELTNWVPVQTPGPRFPHDMAISENYSILMDLPVYMNPEALQAGKWRMDFYPESRSRFAVIPRHGNEGDIRWYDAEPCYIYHTINAWEEGDWLVMVGCRTPEPIPQRDDSDSELRRMIKQLQLRAHMHCWRFNLKTGETREQQLDDRNTEFPMMNTARLGLPTRYSYNVTIADTDTLLFGGVAKYDTEADTCTVHGWGDGVWGSEAPFCGADGGVDEDDGYVVAFTWDEKTNQSECRVLDARHIELGPIARIIIPQRVPLGFHSTWVSAEQLRRDGLWKAVESA